MSFELIETVDIGSSGASTIEFNSIPQDGTDLYLTLSSRVGSGSASDVRIKFNDDTGSNYNYVYIRGSGSPSRSDAQNQSTFTIAYASGPSNGANNFASATIYVTNYADSTRAKSMSNELVVSGENANIAQFQAGVWDNNAAMTKITLTPNSDFQEHTTASLYKITAA